MNFFNSNTIPNLYHTNRGGLKYNFKAWVTPPQLFVPIHPPQSHYPHLGCTYQTTVREPSLTQKRECSTPTKNTLTLSRKLSPNNISVLCRPKPRRSVHGRRGNWKRRYKTEVCTGSCLQFAYGHGTKNIKGRMSGYSI